MNQSLQEEIFDAEKIRKFAINIIERFLKDQKYDPTLNGDKCRKITSSILSKIAPNCETKFKFVTHCMISPCETSGYDSYSKNYWCEATDGMCVVNYQNSNLKFSITIWGVRS